jgi:hypothetical protein
MGALRLSLVAATLTLACLDTFLVTRLVLDRARTQTVVQERVSLEREVQELQDSVETSSPVIPAAAPAKSEKPPPVHRPRDSKSGPKITPVSLEAQLRKVTEPGARDASVEERKGTLREYYIGLARELRLSPGESEAVFDILADHAVSLEAKAYRAMMAGGEGWQDRNALDEDTRARLLAVLGASRFTEFLHYHDYLPERHAMAGLRSRLRAADAFGNSESAQLTEILRDERRRLTASLAPFGRAIRYETGYPENARRYGRDRAAQLRFDAEQIGRVADHYARIRDRAAAFLTPQQMQGLKAQHEGELTSMRAFLMLTSRMDLEVEAIRREAAAK